MEIKPEQRIAVTKSTITMNGSPVSLEAVPETANYRGFLSPDQSITLTSFLTTIVSKDCKVAIPLAIVELNLDVNEKSELRSFTTRVAAEDVADQLSLGEVIALLGVSIDEKQLPTLQIGIQALSCDLEAKQFAMQGVVKADQKQAELQLEVVLLPEGGVELSCDYHSEAEACLTLGDLIVNTLPASFKDNLPVQQDVSENALLQNLTRSGLTDLQLNLNSTEQAMSLFARGTLLGMPGGDRIFNSAFC